MTEPGAPVSAAPPDEELPPAAPSGAGRRRAERRRRRRRRRIAVVAVLAVAGLATLGVTTYLAEREPPVPAASVQVGRTQRTLLVQLQGADRTAAGSVLLAHDPAAGGTGAGLLVPPAVAATPPGSTALPYAQVLASFPPETSRKALADLLGVTVDAAWVLDLPTATRLVDGLGGIRVGVDVPVLGGPDRRTVVLQPGEQPVDGLRAVAYATYLADGEPEQARLARLQEVVDGVLAALPQQPAQVAGLLDTLGGGSVLVGTSVTPLSEQLVGLAADEAAGTLQYDTVPVLPADTGFRLDAERSRGVVDRLLAGSVPAGAREGGNRVKVFNGVGTPLLGEQVRDRLVEAGLVYVPGGNAPQFGVQKSEVQIGDATPEAVALGQRVAAALGLPASSVRTSQPTTVADVVVVVGADFVAAQASASPGASPR